MQTFSFILEEQRRRHQSAHPEVFGELTLSVLKLYTFTDLVTGYGTLPKWQLIGPNLGGSPLRLLWVITMDVLLHTCYIQFGTSMTNTTCPICFECELPCLRNVPFEWRDLGLTPRWVGISLALGPPTRDVGGQWLNQTPLLQITMWTIQAEYGM